MKARLARVKGDSPKTTDGSIGHSMALHGLLRSALAPDPAGLVTGIGEVVPRAFNAGVGGAMPGLEAAADFTYA